MGRERGYGMFRKRTDRGSLSLEQALTIALLVLVAAGTLLMLGNAIMCMYANQTAEIGGQEYPGRCVDIRRLAAEDNGDGTVTLTWVGGEAPFVVSRSDTELVAFEAPDDPFLGVAYAATEAVEDLDGDDTNRSAIVELVPGDNYFQVAEAGGDTVVTAAMAGPEASMPLCFITAGRSIDTQNLVPPVTFEVEWSSGSRTWVQFSTAYSRQILINSYLTDAELGSSVRVPVLDEPVIIRATSPGYHPVEVVVSFDELWAVWAAANVTESAAEMPEWVAADGSSVGPYPTIPAAGLYVMYDTPLEPELRLIMAEAPM